MKSFYRTDIQQAATTDIKVSLRLALTKGSDAMLEMMRASQISQQSGMLTFVSESKDTS